MLSQCVQQMKRMILDSQNADKDKNDEQLTKNSRSSVRTINDAATQAK